MTVEEGKAQNTYQRLADVSLRTCATALTILFAYAFAIGSKAPTDVKYYILGIGLVLLFSVITSLVSLFGVSEKEMRYIKYFAIVSTLLMVVGMIAAFILLVMALFQ
jgi:uncharacterized membrane protein